MHNLVSIDFFIVPTIRFKLLFVLVVLEYSRRKVLHFNVTGNPTAQWTAQQIVEAFHGAARQSIFYEIVMRSTAARFDGRSRAWESSRFSAHREVHGRTRS